MDIRSFINILWLFGLPPSTMLGQRQYPKLHKYFMAIRSYVNILCNFGLPPSAMLGQHEYPKLHKYSCCPSIAEGGSPNNIGIQSRISVLCNFGGYEYPNSHKTFYGYSGT